MTEFARREPLHRGNFVGLARDHQPRTRRAGNDLAFGFRARLAITGVAIAIIVFFVLMAASSPIYLFMWPAVVVPTTAMAAGVLRDLWKSVPVATTASEPPPRPTWGAVWETVRPRMPSGPIPRSTKVTLAAMGALYAATVTIYVLGNDDVKGVIAVCVILTTFVLLMAWSLRR